MEELASIEFDLIENDPPVIQTHSAALQAFTAANSLVSHGERVKLTIHKIKPPEE